MIVGTAGHIDHGKSALVRALTGVDTDRLAEEKRRGISIDLGFAYLPVGDTVLGFVDVPGHEHFIHNMLAGATGIDFVLLVVAADDGIMPQTVEHLAILDLLGIERGLVALTKSDLVTPERRAAIAAQIRSLLASTTLADADVVKVSTVTGTGVDDICRRLADAAHRIAARNRDGRFRLAVDRRFTLRGIGTVVTGTVLSGAVSVGDRVTLSPSGLAARVRSIHAQNRPAEHGVAGERCALNLTGDGIATDAIARGDMVVDPSLHEPTQRIDARLRLLTTEHKPVGVWLPARLHHAATEVGARVVPLDAMPLEPGGEGWVQLVLDRPIAAAIGDRFVLRDTSAQRTIGGGRFVDLRAPTRKRRTPERLARLAALSIAEPADALARLLELPPYVVDVTALARDRASIPDATPPDAILLPSGRVTAAMSSSRWAPFATALVARLAAFHDAHPEAPGMASETLRRAVEPRLGEAIFSAALAKLASDGTIALDGGAARLPRHESRLTPEQDALWRKIEPLLSAEARFKPPRLGEIAKQLGTTEQAPRRLLKLVARLGFVDEIASDHYFLRTAVREAVSIVAALTAASPDSQFGAADLRDRLDTGRKNAIEILEYFDRRGVTIRRGDLRRIDPRKLEQLRSY